MSKKFVYVYDGKQYDLLSQVRYASGMSIPENPPVELLNQSGIEYVEIEDDTGKTEVSAEEIAKEQMIANKNRRDKAVKLLKVTVNGKTFDCDELSQERMNKVIMMHVASGKDLNSSTVLWTLADNSCEEVAVKTMLDALMIAQEAQTAIWQTPYTGEDVDEIELPEGASIDIYDLNEWPRPVEDA